MFLTTNIIGSLPIEAQRFYEEERVMNETKIDPTQIRTVNKFGKGIVSKSLVAETVAMQRQSIGLGALKQLAIDLRRVGLSDEQSMRHLAERTKELKIPLHWAAWAWREANGDKAALYRDPVAASWKMLSLSDVDGIVSALRLEVAEMMRLGLIAQEASTNQR